MNTKRTPDGFTLVEIMVSVSIFSLMLYAVFTGLMGSNEIMRFESKMDSAEGGATRLLDRMGRDIRESSYAYIFAGDYYATRDLTGIDIEVARNYFSSNPLLGGKTLVPGISNENWGQCTNQVCGWCNTFGAGSNPIIPNAFLSRPTRNNLQAGAPAYPPLFFQFSAQDARGRRVSHVRPGDPCPVCGMPLSSDAYFGGLLFFSPRKSDNTFSYIDASDEVQWESMVFYCPFRRTQGGCEIRRYVFYASSIDPNACLTDLLDFDDNGVIESPPMTDTFGDFALDADGECFSLISAVGGNKLLYARWDTGAGRSFRIDVNRTSGVADVTVVGGPYGTGATQIIQLKMDWYARGLSDFEASTFLNNPSWDSGGLIINPTGVAELGVVRITFQVDRLERPNPDYLESVQTIMFRPRN